MSKQYHYVVGYDDTSMKWFVEYDTTAYFQDGNVWDDEQYREQFYGWSVPEEGSRSEAIDNKCMNMLNSLVTIWPSPLVNGEL
jgi:hypothetical protein